jgi:copper chaperone CopZ
MNKLIIIVKDMHCSNCAMTIEGIEDDLPGIIKISASYRRGIVEVEYDPQDTGEAEIRAAIEQLGYHLQ